MHFRFQYVKDLSQSFLLFVLEKTLFKGAQALSTHICNRSIIRVFGGMPPCRGRGIPTDFVSCGAFNDMNGKDNVAAPIIVKMDFFGGEERETSF